jgi:MFS family permease
MAEVTAIARAPGEPLDPRRWAALAILLVGAFLAPLDFFIVNVAMPAMAASLKASAAEMQLVISGYAIV